MGSFNEADGGVFLPMPDRLGDMRVGEFGIDGVVNNAAGPEFLLVGHRGDFGLEVTFTGKDRPAGRARLAESSEDDIEVPVRGSVEDLVGDGFPLVDSGANLVRNEVELLGGCGIRCRRRGGQRKHRTSSSQARTSTRHAMYILSAG